MYTLKSLVSDHRLRAGVYKCDLIRIQVLRAGIVKGLIVI